ncbi:hypothetical protein NA57DRAFT_45730 [Rhizodiscina lignyota]|uniref:BHLH domain-containing protein n=1 Tax=Rhizodiscina lignyota TaxID=1504668 RepID=A0A9P4I4L2_9PEZI|nr:hypothetical protein NA57DRAFT_45730 [Rhizodiscina lignyota]
MDSHGSPYIKSEEDEFSFNSNFINMPQQYQNQQFQGQNMDMGSVNPSDLTMSNSMGNGMNNSFGNGNVSGGYLVGKSNITDDELLDLNPYNPHEDGNQMQQNAQNVFQNQGHQSGMPVNQQQRMQQMYSNTPDGAPIMSPFQNGNFDYSGFGPSMPGSVVQNGSFRNKLPPQMSRHPSERSPMTPKINGLHLGTPDSGNFLSNQQFHRQNRSESGQWNGTPGSGSWVDSPAQSPHQGSLHHPQISEVISSGKHASLPAKVDGAGPNYQSQEAKRRRRRESHNLVERRRRDNINERIQDLSKLVPQHRLEDEKIRKHITANGPLSPGLAAGGISPPQATSLLAGGSGRRAAGGITQGLPPDEKDKGPNKGDILNSSVSWTRDLMWLLYQKIENENKLKSQFAAEGRPWPFPTDEDEKRMITELSDAVQRNGVAQFEYSRFPGSGLRVPKHTNYAGEPLQGAADSPQSLSPGVASGGSGEAQNDGSFWVGHQPNSDDNFALKEEDEFGMDMG